MATIETKLLSAAEKLTRAVNALTREIKEAKAAPPAPAPARMTWQEAVRVLKQTCFNASDCTVCPARAWCDAVIDDEENTPIEWPDPDEVGKA